MRAIELANFAKSQGIEHSKLPKLKEVIASVKDKVLIFTSYRDSVNVINETLQKILDQTTKKKKIMEKKLQQKKR